MDKIAELFEKLGPGGVAVVARTPYGEADRKVAARIGFSQALAERGMTPSDVEHVLSTGKTATVGELALLWGGGSALAILGSYLLGDYTGKMHRGIERNVEGLDDKKSNQLKEKLKMLNGRKMDLESDLKARGALGTSGSSPRSSAVSAPASSAISLVD